MQELSAEKSLKNRLSSQTVARLGEKGGPIGSCWETRQGPRASQGCPGRVSLDGDVAWQ